MLLFSLQIRLAPADTHGMIVKAPDTDRGSDPLNAAGLAAEKTMACACEACGTTVHVFTNPGVVPPA